jgi:hypothetical protein
LQHKAKDNGLCRHQRENRAGHYTIAAKGKHKIKLRLLQSPCSGAFLYLKTPLKIKVLPRQNFYEYSV